MQTERFKRLAARATRNRAFKRKLPEDLGSARFYASTEGGLKYLKRRAEEVDASLTAFARDYVKPGHTVWDVGANVGLFTFAASGLAGPRGHVIAFEPDPWLASLLRRSALLNRQASPVDIICAAVSAEAGLNRFLIANQSRACNALDGLGNSTMAGVREQMLVMATTLDLALAFNPAPDVLKIDTEGAETLVLQGATLVLTSIRPTILIEVNEENIASVAKIMNQYQYTLLDAELRTETAKPVFNTICVPQAVPNNLVLPNSEPSRTL